MLIKINIVYSIHLVISKSEPPIAQRERIYGLARGLAHLRITTINAELMLESVQIERVDSIPAVNAEQMSVRFHFEDVTVKHYLVESFTGV